MPQIIVIVEPMVDSSKLDQFRRKLRMDYATTNADVPGYDGILLLNCISVLNMSNFSLLCMGRLNLLISI